MTEQIQLPIAIYRCYLAPMGAAGRRHGTRTFTVEARTERKARSMAIAYAQRLHPVRYSKERVGKALTLHCEGVA